MSQVYLYVIFISHFGLFEKSSIDCKSLSKPELNVVNILLLFVGATSEIFSQIFEWLIRCCIPDEDYVISDGVISCEVLHLGALSGVAVICLYTTRVYKQ